MSAPVKEEPEEEESVAAENNAPSKPKKKPEYRSWTINKDGQALAIETAIFVELKDGDITIRDGKKGLVATVPVKSLSAADKEYLRDLLQ